MNITKAQFRWLVTASIVASIMGVAVSLAGESLLPPPLREYLAAQREAKMTAPEIVVGVVCILLLIAIGVSLIGLYRFWWFARPLTVIGWIGALIVQPFAGPTVDPGLATSLYELAAVLGGIILAVIYITPAKAWFEKTRQ